jgi:hypothetical protein
MGSQDLQHDERRFLYSVDEHPISYRGRISPHKEIFRDGTGALLRRPFDPLAWKPG